MKRYLVFGGYRYYPSGGWDDLRDSFATVEEATKFASEHNDTMCYDVGLDWWHVVDSRTKKVVARGQGPTTLVYDSSR